MSTELHGAANMAESAEYSSSFPFVKMEHDILSLWEEERVFEQSLEFTKDKKPYIFYDGPPFATGLPHHGNLLASIIKDVVPRYWTMRGRYVLRRFGWDCHGLPIEHEIDKQLGMSAQEAIAKLGVAGYNAECRGIVEKYVDQWRAIITRIGRWVDFDNDYKTMDAWYMESVWWVVKQLWDKGLIYRGQKVMPVSTALQTVLANFEATSNYKDVQDPAITVLFRLADEDAFVAAWTTTPWTLPSNLALCVGADIDYVRVADKESGRRIYLAEARLEEYGNTHQLTVETRLKGFHLLGKKYVPLFEYFKSEAERGAFVVVADDYVTTDEGTGVVHQAPAFGEDDYRVFQANGIEAFVCPVTMGGRFTDDVKDFAGMSVKDADKDIIQFLKESEAIWDQETIQHSYPHCYRSDTPLIYRAVPSWFVRVTDFIDDLAAANEQILWVPGHIKDGRFGHWLESAIDWAISRNRVWGTPLPIWENEVSGNRICVGSIDELEQLSGERVEDLHREFVDPLEFEVDGEEGMYRRVEEVLDCWFESGSMPYAQLHYPFENEKVFEQGFPAEFIAEGLDQTRGWFYTLTVLAAALYEKPAFRNVIVNGMVMAEDGKKMSKSQQNYTPPGDLMETYGADALRLYLINSGLVRGEEQRFADSGVRDMARRALLPWYNAFSFLQTYASIDHWTPDKGDYIGSNILDRWILSKLQTLKAGIRNEMEQYRLYNVVPKLFDFIEDLTNWYIRLNRSRYWGDEITADKIAAYSTLYRAVRELSIVMAPFAPFLSEHVYRQISDLAEERPKPSSVHLCSYPEADGSEIHRDLEDAVTRMQQVVLLGRRKREAVKINLRTPLSLVTIVHRDRDVLEVIRGLDEYVRSELNVKEVRYATEETDYIVLYAKPNFPVLGKRLGKRMKEYQELIESMTPGDIANFHDEKGVTLGGERFTEEEIQVFREAKPGTNVITDRLISIDLVCELNDELVMEGYAREAVNRIQRGRRDAGLEISDRIRLVYSGDERVLEALGIHAEYVARETLATEFEPGPTVQFDAEIDGMRLGFDISVIGIN
jgi:isoleucyl-tRNA synthetase